MITQLEIEDLTHLVVYDFPLNNGKHHTQADGIPKKVILLFSIDGSPEHIAPLRLAAIRVPRALPIYRIREFVSHVEDKLREIYGHCKRNNVVLTANEDAETWNYETKLPMHGVFYA